MNIHFSVLMSVYAKDNPEHLAEALKSIYENQSVKPNQIVIVFDGPISKALEGVVAQFMEGKDNIEIVRLGKNMGLGNALRIGTEYCKHQYIMRMDADDISEPHRFEKQLEFVKSHPEVDVVGGYIAEFEVTPNDKTSRRVVPLNESGIRKMAKTRNPMNHVTVCIKKSALEKVQGYKECLCMEDYYLWIRMLHANLLLVNIPQVLVYVRIGNGFNNRRSGKQQVVGRRIIQKALIEYKMVSHVTAAKNMLLAYGLCFSPGWFKNMIYHNILRKRG